MGSQSETLAIHIKITYLNKELWNIFQYRPQWAQLCQHVWASRNISVHFQMKHLASFLSLTTRETRNKTERNLTDLVSGSPTTLYNKHQTAQLKRLWTADCGLRTADCGLWTMDSGPHLREKNSSAHIVILKRFLKFAIAKIEMSNSSSLPLTPPCWEAWPPRLGNRGESPLKVTGMFVAFHREEVVRFECSIFLTIGVPPIVVRKEIS